MSGSNATTYNKILSKGIEANLPETIGNNKLRFTTDTGRLFLDNEGSERVEITDFIKGKTKEEILGTLAPLPKFYLASDTQEVYYYDATSDEWKSIKATEAVNASTAQYAVESGHSVNADTATFATNASTASYATNAGASGDGIAQITRSGLTFIATRNDSSTFSFTQQDNDTTYSLATTASSGLMPALDTDDTKYLRADGTWVVPPNSTYENMSTAEGIAGSSTESKVMTAANLKGILEGSTYIHSYAPCVEADFDFGELTTTGEVYNN